MHNYTKIRTNRAFLLASEGAGCLGEDEFIIADRPRSEAPILLEEGISLYNENVLRVTEANGTNKLLVT